MESLERIFVGREAEINILKELFTRNQSDLIAVLGRRRIGKTYLVKKVFKDHLIFHFTGIKNADKNTVIKEFTRKITELSHSAFAIAPPTTWMDTFGLLKSYLKSINSKKKKVVFLDEFPWMDTHKSGFLSAFEYFWNDWAVDQNIIIVVCGSSTSWMLKNVVNNKAGLHNRITKYINLHPFTL